MARSPFYVVKRRGIFLPEDVWFTFRDGVLVPTISNPHDPEQSRVAFQSFVQANSWPEVHTCDFYGYKTRNLTRRLGSGYRLLGDDGNLVGGAGWVNGNTLLCFTDIDSEPRLIRVKDAN